MRVNKKRVMFLQTQQQNNRVIYNVALEDGQNISLVMTSAFRHLPVEHVLKVLHKGDVDVTRETIQGNVNFRITVQNRNVLFINWYDSGIDLDDDSDDKEKAAAVKELKNKLKKVKAADIQTPLTEEEADSLIASL